MKTFLILFIVFSFVFVGCSIMQPEVKYKVTGTAEFADVTYENQGGGTSQESNQPVPWAYNFTAGSRLMWVYLSAQNCGEEGTVTVTIFKNGKVYKRSSSSGAYCIATTYGTLDKTY